jgi:hypothetical protein
MRDFYAELAALEGVLGFNPSLVEQGSEQWHRMRSGVVTASKAECLLAKPGTAKRSAYMAELVAQVCTGLLPDEINAKSLRWGKDHEEDARDAYSAATFEIVGELPFIYKDNTMRFGLSPDGICSKYGLELKCPWASRTFIEFVAADKIKPEYEKQCQFSMWGSDLDRWDFANYDPRMHNCKKLHYVTIERDEKIMLEFDEKGATFVEDMDEMLNNMGVKFGQQWELN